MRNIVLIAITFAFAFFGGTGAYVLSGSLMNLIVMAGLSVFAMKLFHQYHDYGIHFIRGEGYKWLALLLYLGFLVFNMLKETLLDLENIYYFNPEGGIVREYTDLLRGFLAFLVTGFIYNSVKYNKIFILMPTISIGIILTSQILEANGVILTNQEMADASDWGATTEDKMLSRPGGFLNANMTAAVALIWLFVTLESKLKTPVIVRGITLVLALSVCMIAQSRMSILFLSIYLIYKTALTANFKFLMTIVMSAIALIIVLNYIDVDFVNNLIERFTDRATHKEDSAAEREYLIYRAISEMQDTPIFGHELYHLHKTYGVSSHNQTLEILNNFGIYGFLSFLMFYIAFYHANNTAYLLLCVLPMLLFSHNFFENSAFQVALGFGYAHASANAQASKQRSLAQIA